MTKTCSKCGIKYKGTTGTYCPPCGNKYRREWFKKNPEKRKEYQFKHNYGITFKRYKEKLEEQNGVCAICKQLEITDKLQYLSVDHDHKFGYNRGLLCHNCNTGLGHFKDDPELLQAAIEYLKEWEV